MRKFVTAASIVVLAASAASCGSTQQSNSAGNILPSDSLVGPSALEARSGQGGGGKGGGKGSGGSGGGTTGGGGGSISLLPPLTDIGTPGLSYLDTITFSVSTTATTKPWVTLKCSQNGTQVYKHSNGIFPTSLDDDFTLGPNPVWQSGGATCTATLEDWDNYPSITPLTSISFDVVG